MFFGRTDPLFASWENLGETFAFPGLALARTTVVRGEGSMSIFKAALFSRVVNSDGLGARACPGL